MPRIQQLAPASLECRLANGLTRYVQCSSLAEAYDEAAAQRARSTTLAVITLRSSAATPPELARWYLTENGWQLDLAHQLRGELVT